MWKKLRKFGLKYCDLPTMIWNVDCMLRLLTLTIDRRNNQKIPISHYVIMLVTSSSYLYVYFFSMYWFVFIRCRETGELFCSLVVFSLGMTSEIGITRLICMFFYQDTVRDIIDGYLACDTLVAPGSRFANNLAKKMRMVKKRALIFWAVIMGDGITYISIALFTPGRHFMEDCFTFYGLEPMFESPNFEIGFIVNAVSVIFVCYLPANITAFFVILTGYTEAYMLTLKGELILLWEDAETCYKENVQIGIDEDYKLIDENNNELFVNKYIKQHLTNVAKQHTIHINLVRQIEVELRRTIAAEFLLVMIGLIAELLAGLENTYLQLPFTLMLIFIDCLVGQRLMDASNIFTDAVYDCKWENFETSNRKIVLLMLQNAQKEMSLSAGGFATLSYVCFMSVIRMIYSAFTALRSMM